jgi:type I restriction enzyme R subunit
MANAEEAHRSQARCAGWVLRRGGVERLSRARRSEEEETSKGPADYALWLDNHVVGIVEAKKLTLGPQNVLTQAQRYAAGLRTPAYSFNGFGCPFLYATNGESRPLPSAIFAGEKVVRRSRRASVVADGL